MAEEGLDNWPVGTLVAEDPDLANNGTVFYWLEQPSNTFKIDSATGEGVFVACRWAGKCLLLVFLTG